MRFDRTFTSAALVFSGVASQTVAAAQTSTMGVDSKNLALATSLVEQAQSGNIDRSMFTATASNALTPQILDKVKARLAPLGTPSKIMFLLRSTRDGNVVNVYRVVWPTITFDESIFQKIGDEKISNLLFRREGANLGSPLSPSATSAP